MHEYSRRSDPATSSSPRTCLWPHRYVAAKAFALNPRGTLYTPDNVKDHLARRDFMESLRSSGERTRGPAPLDKTDVQAFANELDKFLTRSRAR
jgi:uncharacterized protein YaiI (UPF0178 family)